MTRRASKILFFVFFLIFLFFAPLMILYYQGWRFDFDPPAGGKRITQTGGLFLKVIPKQAEIYLDGKLVKKTDFFFGSLLIENLLPKRYLVEAKKNGYFSWKKDLEIKEREVTEAKNIVLFPENMDFEILAKNVEKLWFSPDGRKIILYEDSTPAGTGWALKLYDLEKNLKSHLIEESDITIKGANLMSLEWSQDSKEVALEVRAQERSKYFALRIDKIPPILTEKEPAPPLSEKLQAFKTFNGNLYLLDEFGQLFKNGERLTQKPFPVKSETEYSLEIFPEDFIFLGENQILYQFNPDSQSFEKFFEKINGLKISPDNKKLLFFSDSEIWVLFLKEKLTRLIEKAGEKILLARFSEKIESAFWLNSDYLIFNAGNKIKIAEIDERDKLNIVDLGEFESPEIFFNQTSDKKLYVLANGILYSSETFFK